jgi:hypothetical protein
VLHDLLDPATFVASSGDFPKVDRFVDEVQRRFT